MARLPATLACLALACASRQGDLIVWVDTDLDVPGELDHVSIAALGEELDGAMVVSADRGVVSAGEFPLTLTLVPARANATVRVEVLGSLAGRIAVSQRARAAFPNDSRDHVIQIWLRRACVGSSACASDEVTCRDGRCVGIDLASLPVWDEAFLRRGDAGPALDAGSDSGPELDAGHDAGVVFVDGCRPITWFPDCDMDGFFADDPLQNMLACERPAVRCNWATIAPDPMQRDCMDGDMRIRPGASETCDGVDEDCDRMVDEELGPTYFRDSDGDGEGDPAVTTHDCRGNPAGYVLTSFDCDDGDANAHPGQTNFFFTPSTRARSFDYDCSGSIEYEITGIFSTCNVGSLAAQCDASMGCRIPGPLWCGVGSPPPCGTVSDLFIGCSAGASCVPLPLTTRQVLCR